MLSNRLKNTWAQFPTARTTLSILRAARVAEVRCFSDTPHGTSYGTPIVVLHTLPVVPFCRRSSVPNPDMIVDEPAIKNNKKGHQRIASKPRVTPTFSSMLMRLANVAHSVYSTLIPCLIQIRQVVVSSHIGMAMAAMGSIIAMATVVLIDSTGAMMVYQGL
ncbi:hypothetical protein B0H19DRAFT_1084216 [Mycena capillaripes]|nr:hypothetical protein B0H19DRAFT_1084216 [Mycena capillaripes]